MVKVQWHLFHSGIFSQSDEAAMPLNSHNRRKFVTRMTRRIAQLRVQTERSLDFAIETMFQERVEDYPRVEQGLIEVDQMLVQVAEEVESICELNTAQR